jgi:excisionase family DNA binding protein
MNEVGDTAMRNGLVLSERNRKERRAARPADRPTHRPARPPGSQEPPGGGTGLWNVADVSAYLHMPVSSIYRMTARKAVVRIPHIRIGGMLRFRQADVDRWLTLLTTSNIEALSKLRQKVSQVTHAHDSQTAPR